MEDEPFKYPPYPPKEKIAMYNTVEPFPKTTREKDHPRIQTTLALTIGDLRFHCHNALDPERPCVSPNFGLDLLLC